MPLSLSVVNRLPKGVRDFLYLKLVPPELLERFGVDPETLRGPSGAKAIRGWFPEDENAASIEVRLRPEDRDPVFFCQISLDEGFKAVVLDLVVINDITGERYNIDRDPEGKDTLFGMLRRNVPEEVKAMRAGLAPGMVRPGLGLLGRFLRCLEVFTDFLGLKTIMLEALFYHTAILFERHGFGYLRGLRLMQTIHREFSPGGKLFEALDGSTPFRVPGVDQTVRGRSWAIQDGILKDALGVDWRPPKMYKLLGKSQRINTFPGQRY